MKKMRLFTMMFLILGMLMIMPLASSAQDDVVTLRFWNADTSGATEAAIAEWNEANPNIQVEFVPYSNDDAGNAQIDTALLAGEVDVFVQFGLQRVDSRARAGLIEPLGEHATMDIEEEFGTAVIQVAGDPVAIAASADPYVVYINASDFEDAGIEVPESWTWDEFIEIADQLTTGDGPSTRYGAFLPTWPWMDEVAAYQQTWDFNVNVEDCTTNFDDPIWAQVADIRYQLETEVGAAIPYADARAAQLSLQNELYNDNVSMIIAGSWILRTTQNTTDFPRNFVTTFAPIPSLDEDGFPYRPGKLGTFYSVASETEHPEEATAFLEWITTEGYIHFVRTGRFPSWSGFEAENVAEAYLSNFEDPESVLDVETFINVVLDDSLALAPQTNLLGTAELQQIWREEAVRVFNGELTGEEAAANMKERGDAALEALCE